MTGEKLDGKSFDNRAARIAALKDMFPEAVREGRFDLDALNSLLEDAEEIYALNEERYEFNWAGKADSLKQAQRRSNGTLRPVQEESRDWETTGNLYLEGDNLEVMKLLQQGYLRKVKMIYIDPPYNTGNDFVYEDDFADPVARYKEITGQGMRANPETAGRYHSRWLSMMYPRLKIAKTLLRDDGVIFISIDDNEVHNLRKLCDEVFGEENFIADIAWEKRYTRNNDAKLMSSVYDHILFYRRSHHIELIREPRTEKANSIYSNPDNDPRGSWTSVSYVGQRTKEQRPSLCYDILNPYTKEECIHPVNAWKYSKEQHSIHVEENRLYWGKNGENAYPRLKRFLSELNDGMVPVNLWSYKDVGTLDEGTKELNELLGKDIFEYPKPKSLLSKMIQLAGVTDNDIIMDFFSGSGTLAHAVMQLNAEDGGNRKFICIQIPEPVAEGSEAAKAGFKTIADIGKERIRRAGEKILAEWKEKNAGRLPLEEEAPTPPDVGFRVFRLDSSNWKPWDDSFVPGDAHDIFMERMDASLDNIKPGRSDLDMVYEVMLKYGVPLTETVTSFTVEGKMFYSTFRRGKMILCLDKDITVEIVEAVIADRTPGVMLFADACFNNNSDLTNTDLVLEKAGIEFRWI